MTGVQEPVQGTSPGSVPVQGTSAGSVTVQGTSAPRQYLLPPAVPVVDESGQTIPGFFTIKNEGDNFSSGNTYNTNDGKVDHCDVTNKEHVWRPRKMTYVREDDTCYNCKSTIQFKFHKCDTCYRSICSPCDHSFNNYANNAFSMEIARIHRGGRPNC